MQSSKLLGQYYNQKYIHIFVIISSSVVVFISKDAYHSWPPYLGGLYLQFAESIISNGWIAPYTVPNYTLGGLRFAYPPLGLYAIAGAMEITPLSPVGILSYAPLVIVPAYSLITYAFTTYLTRDRRIALLSSVFVATSPEVTNAHLAGGGTVRGLSYLFLISGLIYGIKNYRDGKNATKTVIAGVFFGLSILTHPKAGYVFGISYFVIYVCFDRTYRGIGSGIITCLVGGIASLPWWGTVIHRFGIEAIFAAFSSRGGLAIEPTTILSTALVARAETVSLVYIAGGFGILYMILKNRYFLPLWLVTLITLQPGSSRFFVLPLAIAASVFIVDVIFPVFVAATESSDQIYLKKINISAVLICLVVLFSVSTGAAYAASYKFYSSESSETDAFPQFVTSGDLDAVNWIESHTETNSTFLITEQSAEWLPYLTNRTTAYVPWGSEWVPKDKRTRQVKKYNAAASCQNAKCVLEVIEEERELINYVYIKLNDKKDRSLIRSLHSSSQFKRQYSTRSVVIFLIR